jgi:hypothetical protein
VTKISKFRGKSISYVLNISILTIILCFNPIWAISPAMAKEKFLDSHIRMMWQVHYYVSDKQLEEFSKLGINVIQSFGIMYWTDVQIKQYLDMALAHNIKVVVYLGGFVRGDGEYDEKAIQKFIQKWAYHLAIWAWHTLDEPINRYSKFFQEEIYQFVKSLDHERPIMISFNGGPAYHWKEYFTEKAFDILDIHRYPNPKLDREEELIKGFLKARTKNYPVIVTLRAFNGPKWVDLPSGSIKAQLDLFKKYNMGDNIAFYGWALSPNVGLNELPDMYSEVKAVLREITGNSSSHTINP